MEGGKGGPREKYQSLSAWMEIAMGSERSLKVMELLT